MPEKRLTQTARKLRREMTEAERALWLHLRQRDLFGVKFIRQHPIGDFIADFACRSLRLAIEVDGGQHSDSPTDVNRTRIIKAHGYCVIRFWNNEVLENMDGVLQVIAKEIAIARNQ
ncbi:endonuclease domain-containing protein [Erythrobacter sp. HL-111]|uniref:endonuclease domain-containing protein n=1 Tax=Erythrobacter sp. HL-111 TaxID=1798193 RepID=UPI000B7F1DE3|nr:endonuclease domain-containing protein [Erythrobacter sp. HL-111]